jgi:hypothetical protein
MFIIGDGEYHILMQTIGGISQSGYRVASLRDKFISVILELKMLQVMIQDYYMQTGKLPDASINKAFNSSYYTELKLFDKVEIQNQGKIIVKLKGALKDEMLVLTPEVSNSGAHINWKCETTIDQMILGIPGGDEVCHHVPIDELHN